MLIGECVAYNHAFLEADPTTVPLSVEVGENTTLKSAHGVVTLSCLAMSYPRASIYWYKEAKPLTPRDNQVIVKSATISHVRVLGTVTINSLKRSDNGTYICEAINEHEASMATQDVVVLEPAEISVDSVEPLDPRTAFLRWSIQYKGNLPIKRYHLQMKNYSTGTDWLDMDDKIPPNATSYTVRYLAPAVTYGFQLAAVNEAGHSAWEAKNVTMPPDVPPKVSWVQMMASTNETLLFGWRKPPHDNGSNITHYVIQLNKEAKLVSNETLPVTPSERQNYIFVFVGLEPGECYAFQVQACSVVGCGSRSHPLDAITSDGMADPPENVEIRCYHDDKQNLNYVVVTWEQPKNVRGTVQAYNITLEGEVRFKNVTGEVVEDHFKEFNEVKKESHVFKSTVKPNTNYTVRVCTINKAGCGPQSKASDKTFCLTPPTIPSSMPEFHLDQMDGREKCTQLKLKLKRISERNGYIRCYRIIVIKLAKGDRLSALPNEPHIFNITSYDETHEESNPRGAYLAETFASEDFVSEVVLGDGQYSLCSLSADQPGIFDRNFRVRRSVDPDEEDLDNVYDGPLNPDTNYTGYVEVHVWGQDGEILSKQSPYFKPVQTSSLSTSGSSSGAAPPANVRPDSPVNFLFAIICGTVLVVLVLILVICLIRRRNSCPYDEDGEHMGLTDLIRRTVHRSNHLPRGSHLAKLPYLGPIAAEELPAAYVEKHLDTDMLFKTEFEALPEVFRDRTTIASDNTENVIKNRYPGLKAYDQTRIRLSASADYPGSDYINANFIEGYRERKLYICTQAPLNCTTTDFWRMIWEHGASVVVMLTGLEENGEEKCCQYWSDGKPLELTRYFSVSLKNFKRCSDYILRTLSLKLVKGGEVEQREVLHFHFLMWSDFLTPGQPSWLLRFIKRVNEHYTSQRGPLVVHCSSGVGRTGTYVAIDNLTQQLDEEGIMDIFAFVSNLRYHRNFLVQTLEEYIFVYRALMEHAQFGDTELELHHLRDHYELLKGKVRDNCRTGLEIEFEKLNDVFEEPKTYCVGAWEINRSKNRYECIIPYDINRVILLPSVTGQSSYINASHVQGYYRSLSFIITQDPLAHTIWDFWRMVKEQNITTLVMLSDVGDDLNKCPQYWPEEDKEEQYDTVRVKLKSSNKSAHYIVRQFVVTDNEDENKHLLTQFQILNWSSSSAGVPDNLSSLITAIEDVQQHQNNQPTSGPITVHCSGGGDRSGIYVALTDLIQQAKSDERVDVFQTTKYARAQRHCLLQTIEQFDFLYRGIIQYVERYNLCNMGDTPL